MDGRRLDRGVARVLLLWLVVASVPVLGRAAETSETLALDSTHTAVGPGLLVRLKDGISAASVQAIFAGAREKQRYDYPANLYWVLPPAGDQGLFATRLKQRADVEYVAPNSIVRAQTVPNDTNFPDQWALQASDAGMNAPALWDALGTGDAEVVIAIVDTGIDCNHKDLEKNLWHHPGEIPGDGVDNDLNGYKDDDVGINTIETTQSPCGAYAHGTWIAGVIAAVGNNGDAGIANGTSLKSIAGVMWKARILPCRFMQSDTGELKNAIACLSYVAKLKDQFPDLRIVATNNSWGDIAYNPALEDAIKAQLGKGILFVTAAGNCVGGPSSCDLDATPFYPASSTQPNVITVAGIGDDGKIAPTSKRGRRSVHVAAPGVGILTTAPNNLLQLVPASTSIAAPHVTGLLGLLAQGGEQPDWRYLRNFVLTTGPKDAALKQGTIAGRRVGGSGAAGKSCTDPALQARLQPKGSSQSVPVNTPVSLSAVHLNCTQPGGPVSVTIVEPDGTVLALQLEDQGNIILDDAVYQWNWTPKQTGDHTVAFFAGAGPGIEDRFTITAQ